MTDPARSPDPSVCPFLRRDVGGQLFAPSSVPGAEQACVAIGSPRAQTLAQQEQVCLRAAHAECPRYQRAALADASGGSRAVPTVPRATLAALLILVLSAGVSFGFVVQRGGLAMPVVGAGESPSAGASGAAPSEAPASLLAQATPTPEATAPATIAPADTASPAATPSDAIPTSPSPTVVPTPTVAPTPEPTATASPVPTKTPKPSKKPDSDRYDLLEPCPDQDGCWIYTVRSGDNLYSIGRYFGHSLATIYEWNPQYPDKRLRVGAEIRMPPPTR